MIVAVDRHLWQWPKGRTKYPWSLWRLPIYRMARSWHGQLSHDIDTVVSQNQWGRTQLYSIQTHAHPLLEELSVRFAYILDNASSL